MHVINNMRGSPKGSPKNMWLDLISMHVTPWKVAFLQILPGEGIWYIRVKRIVYESNHEVAAGVLKLWLPDYSWGK